jgi:hypothetical protein
MGNSGKTDGSAPIGVRYWSYLIAKLGVATLLMQGLRKGVLHFFPAPAPLFDTVNRPFGTSLSYTITMMGLWLVGAAMIWLVIWDQRFRCRTCVRRLRMPIATGSWTNVLFSRPRTEYICPYGHGTLKVEELQITGHSEPDWEPHEDMWKELISYDESKK